MPAAAYSAHGLTVDLDGQTILDHIQTEIASGEWTALVGPNGSGKTTLLRTLAGLLPYSGTLQLRDRDLSSWQPKDRAREVALVRQHTDLPFAFSVREVIGMGRAPHLGWLSPLSGLDRDKVDNAITDFGLKSLASRAVSALSGGEQQRVLLAQAIAQEASVLLLDEPTAHLDVRHRIDVLDHVRRLVDGGQTAIAAMHDLEWAARYADRLVVLHRGQIAASGVPADVLTPQLLAEVFGVRAEVEPTASGVAVRYLGRHAPEASHSAETSVSSPAP